MRRPPREFELRAEALHRKPVDTILDLDEHGRIVWPPYEDVVLRMRGHEFGPIVRMPRHPCPRAEAFRLRAYEDEKSQNTHRLRPVNRTFRDRVMIEIIGDACPNEEIDEYIMIPPGESWAPILPSHEDMRAIDGLLPAVDGRGFVKAMFTLTPGDYGWPNEHAAKVWFQEAGKRRDPRAKVRRNTAPDLTADSSGESFPLSFYKDESAVKSGPAGLSAVCLPSMSWSWSPGQRRCSGSKSRSAAGTRG
jgi:hypothetical protein